MKLAIQWSITIKYIWTYSECKVHFGVYKCLNTFVFISPTFKFSKRRLKVSSVQHFHTYFWPSYTADYYLWWKLGPVPNGTLNPRVYFGRPYKQRPRDVIFVIRNILGHPHTLSTCNPIFVTAQTVSVQQHMCEWLERLKTKSTDSRLHMHRIPLSVPKANGI